MTNSECIYRKKIDYISRMAFEKKDSEDFQLSENFMLQEIKGEMGPSAVQYFTVSELGLS